MIIPNTIYLYRITHLENLPFILNLGKLTCPSHPEADPNYIGIGDSTLISSRNTKYIPIYPNGNFTDYVSFYFGSRSPMLYAIQKGFNGVIKRNPQDIIYLVTTFEMVENEKCSFVFTDGHGYHSFSQFFNKKLT